MTLDLTREDRAAIARALQSAGLKSANSRLDEDIYRAGLAAGRARAIEECAKVCEADIVNRPSDPPANYFDGGLRHCAAAIRALK